MDLSKYYANEDADKVPMAHWIAKMIALGSSGPDVRYVLAQCDSFTMHAAMCTATLAEARNMFHASGQDWPGILGFLDKLGDLDDADLTRVNKAMYKHMKDAHLITIDINNL